MIKKYLTLTNIISFFWIAVLFLISQFYPDYKRYSLYVSIIIMIPFIIVNLVKKRREDKTNGTENFKLSIYNIVIAMVFVGILFFLINSNYPSGF